MKKSSILLAAILLIASACNNNDKKPEKENKPVTAVDSILNVIDEGHMEGMGKIGRLHNTKKAVQAAIDSIGKLPGKAQANMANYLENLKSTIKDLDYADMAMDKWMTEYDEDSAIDNEQARLKYLEGEKIKVENVRLAIRNSLQKADSLLKVKL